MTKQPDRSRLRFRKSTRSTSTGGNCVEIAAYANGRLYAVRDSKDKDGPILYGLTARDVRALVTVKDMRGQNL